MVITYVAFAILSTVCMIITAYTWRAYQASAATVINNPNFTKFQRQYFSAYFLALIADWLQGPYLYQLYREYVLPISMGEEISVLYLQLYTLLLVL